MQSILTLSAALKERILPNEESVGKIAVYLSQKRNQTFEESLPEREDFSVTAD